MRIDSYQCDECGVQKQQSNHWIIALVRDRLLGFWSWDDELALCKGYRHLCGEGCAAKALSKQIAKWKEQ